MCVYRHCIAFCNVFLKLNQVDLCEACSFDSGVASGMIHLIDWEIVT
jgi:hypothetical protein